MLFCLQALFFSYSHAASAVSKKNAGYSPAFATALRIELEEVRKIKARRIEEGIYYLGGIPFPCSF